MYRPITLNNIVAKIEANKQREAEQRNQERAAAELALPVAREGVLARLAEFEKTREPVVYTFPYESEKVRGLVCSALHQELNALVPGCATRVGFNGCTLEVDAEMVFSKLVYS